MTRYFTINEQGEQIEIAKGWRIESAHQRQVGEKFVARTDLLAKIGSVFGLTCGGKRYGSARVVGKLCDNPKYQVQMQRRGGVNPTNMADHQYEFEVEYSEQVESCAPRDRWNTST